MRSFTTTTTALLALPLALAQQATTSPKRGLAHVGDDIAASDNSYWDGSDSDLTWYYNWANSPSTDLNDKLQFVPMLWGSGGSENFYTTVKAQIDGGSNVTWYDTEGRKAYREAQGFSGYTRVLGFNEPDGCEGVYGASCLDAETAAEIWIAQIEPLREHGVSLGGPAVTGAPDGFNWLRNFFTACNGQCHPDFLPIHFYGTFQGLADHVGQVNATYPNMTFWVTEFAYPDAEDLEDAQTQFNMSIAFLDQHEYVDKYSYFGAFRSDKSNVGADAAMLTQKGELTDIGAWYLGQEATGNVPKGSASQAATFMGSTFFVIAIGFWCLA